MPHGRLLTQKLNETDIPNPVPSVTRMPTVKQGLLRVLRRGMSTAVY